VVSRSAGAGSYRVPVGISGSVSQAVDSWLLAVLEPKTLSGMIGTPASNESIGWIVKSSKRPKEQSVCSYPNLYSGRDVEKS
jgi:hypothetical protein